MSCPPSRVGQHGAIGMATERSATTRLRTHRVLRLGQHRCDEPAVHWLGAELPLYLLQARAGWISTLLLKNLRKQCNHPAQRTLQAFRSFRFWIRSSTRIRRRLQASGSMNSYLALFRLAMPTMHRTAGESLESWATCHSSVSGISDIFQSQKPRVMQTDNGSEFISGE